LSDNVATDTVFQMSQQLAVVAGTCGHAVATQAVAGSCEVCPSLYASAKYLDLMLVRSQCSEDLQHHSPITNHVTKIFCNSCCTNKLTHFYNPAETGNDVKLARET